MFVSKTTGSPSLNLPRDSNFNSNLLLLHGDGVSGANNTLFIDNAITNTFVPFQGGYSYFFNGSSYLTVTNNVGLQFGTGDFTIEAWIYNTSSAAAAKQIFSHWSVSASQAYQLFIRTNNRVTWQIFNQAAPDVAALDVPVNTWTHVAWSKIGTTAYLFINGVLKDTFTGVTNSANGNATNPWIGTQNGAQFWNGYISNLRVVKGIGLYTSDFTPQTTALTSVPGTSLLTCQSDRIVDNALNTTLTSVGTPAISSGGSAIVPAGKPLLGTFSPFSQTGWSNYFNGSSDYLSATVPAPGSNFTVEGWVNFTTVGSGVGNSPTSFAILGSASSTGFQVYGSALGWAVRNNTQNILGVGGSAGLGTPPVAGQWNHVAFVRDSGTVTLYVNGNSVGANSTAFTFSDTTFTIGNSLTGTSFMNGYVSNVRYINNLALYTSNFTVPTTPLTDVANTVFLTSQSNRFVDNSANNRTITVTSSPTVQSFSPFAPSAAYSKNKVGGSMYETGTADWLSFTTSALTSMGTGDWTFEFWIYWTGVSTNDTDFIRYNYTGNDWAIGIYNTATSLSVVNFAGAERYYFGNKTQIPLNQWTHVAFTRSGTNMRCFINGVQDSGGTLTTTAGTNMFNSTGQVASLFRNFSAANYISSARFIKGTALYTANFTLPAAPLTAVSGTVLLLNYTNAGIIDQTGKNNVTTYGSASISSTQSKFGGTSMSFNGTSDYLQFKPGFVVPQNNPYTFECWFYLNNTTFAAYYTLLGQSIGGTGGNLNIRLNNTTTVQVDQLGLSGQTFTIPTLSAGQWYHIAVTRNASNGTDVWLNGIKSSTGTVTLDKNYGAITDVIGANNDAGIGKYFPGFIDDVRFSLGVARYTANFTPPARKFEDR